MLLLIDKVQLVPLFPNHPFILLSILNLSFSFFKNATFKHFLCPPSYGLIIHFYRLKFLALNGLNQKQLSYTSENKWRIHFQSSPTCSNNRAQRPVFGFQYFEVLPLFSLLLVSNFHVFLVSQMFWWLLLVNMMSLLILLIMLCFSFV